MKRTSKRKGAEASTHVTGDVFGIEAATSSVGVTYVILGCFDQAWDKTLGPHCITSNSYALLYFLNFIVSTLKDGK